MRTLTLYTLRTTSVLAAAVLASALTPALADVSRGQVEARAWTPALAEASDQVIRINGALSLQPLAVSAGEHPRDAPLTTQAAASLVFERPYQGNATYRSFAGAFGRYASASYVKQASTSFVLEGSLRLDAADALTLLGQLPDTLDIDLQVSSLLTGQLVATSLGGGTPRTGLNVDWQVSGWQRTGSLRLTGQYMMGEPTVQANGLFSDPNDWTRRSFSPVDLEAMFGTPPAPNASGMGVSLFSLDRVDFSAHFTSQRNTLGNVVSYETPVRFAIDTYADLGTGEWAFGATDLRNTLHFDFALLDASGQPLDLPVDLVLSNVPEPASAWLLALGLALTGAAARQRNRPAAAPAA